VGLDAQVLGYRLGAGIGTTAGQAARKLYSCSGSSGDVVQTTASSQPLLLVHSGANYWQGPNVTNNVVSTPDAAANRISGDLDIIVYVKHTNNTTLNSLVSKNDSGTQRGYSLVFETNALTLYYGTTTLNAATSTATIASGTALWVRCTRNSSTGDIIFYTSNDSINTNPQSVTWTQLGTTISGIAGNLNSSGTLPLIIGGYISANSGFSSLEKIYRLTISNSIGGAPVVDFNPNQYNAANSQTQWVSTTGETWTINVGTASTGYKGALVSKTIVQGDGIDDVLNSGTLASVSTFTRYVAMNPFQRAGFGVLVSGGTSLNTALYKDSSAIRIYNGGAGVGALSFTSPSSHLLALFTADYNAANSKAAINNGTDATGTIGDNASDAIILFRTNTDSGNGMISTIISCKNVNNTSQKTSIYNYIRSINGNSF
jgi:hypothetical protein